MIEWKNAQPVTQKAYVCGHCGTKVAPDRGLSGVAVAYHNFQRLEFGAWMQLCVECGMPTVFVMQDDPTEDPFQTPASAYGDAIPNLPEKVEAIFMSPSPKTTSRPRSWRRLRTGPRPRFWERTSPIRWR